MVRLKDIAQRAGVSVMTVSKALRGAVDVSDATRAKVKALAEEMGYVPDPSAQGLRTKTTRLLGLVVPAMTDPVFSRVVLAIEEHAHELGYDILLAHTLNKPERWRRRCRRFCSARPRRFAASSSMSMWTTLPRARRRRSICWNSVTDGLLFSPGRWPRPGRKAVTKAINARYATRTWTWMKN